MKRPVIVDTNILFSALLRRNSRLRERLALGPAKFHAPQFVVVELFKHKERIADLSELTGDELMEARRLCAGIDLKDTPFMALTLHLDGVLWTVDAELRDGLSARGFSHFFSIPES
jgi:predicted nucleic acid-binding protein